MAKVVEMISHGYYFNDLLALQRAIDKKGKLSNFLKF